MQPKKREITKKNVSVSVLFLYFESCLCKIFIYSILPYIKITFSRFLKVYERSQDIRRLGSAALELAYTACGRQGGYFEIYLNPWDYAAGMLLVKEAGGTVTDWSGNALNPAQGSQVIGTNGKVHEELLKQLL